MSFKSQAKYNSQSGAEQFASAKCGTSMSATRLMPHKRIRENPAFRAGPLGSIRIASSMSPTRLLRPSDLQVPHLLHALHCAQCLLRPFRHCRASGILRIASSTSYTCADSAQQLLRPSALQVPYLLHACHCVQCLLRPLDLRVPLELHA